MNAGHQQARPLWRPYRRTAKASGVAGRSGVRAAATRRHHALASERGFVRIDLTELQALTDTDDERNIYAHPNRLARWVFWQRLEAAHRLLARHAPQEAIALDVGGGQGVFLPSLCGLFQELTVIDLELGDARRIAEHFGLHGVRFVERDINLFEESCDFDVIIATDVLEHFSNMEQPFRFITQHLKPGGLLLLSLPTENWVYKLGRFLIRKHKPLDHYHSADALLRFYHRRGFAPVANRFVPRCLGFALPVFHIAMLRKESAS